MTDDESLAAFQARAQSARLAGINAPLNLAEHSGEHRLMLAILEDAIMLFVKSVSENVVAGQEARAARAWLESRDRSSPFAFESVCDTLGLDSGYIRRGLWTVRARPAEAAARFAACHHPSSGLPRRTARG